MSEIERPEALYRQVAAAIRDAIVSGEYPPGAPLPSEAELIRRYQVSRPTVRNAVAALRAEGLLEVIHGKGSFVRRVASPVLTIDRSAGHIDAGAMTAASAAGWEEVEEPHIHRTHTTRSPALCWDSAKTKRCWQSTGCSPMTPRRHGSCTRRSCRSPPPREPSWRTTRAPGPRGSMPYWPRPAIRSGGRRPSAPGCRSRTSVPRSGSRTASPLLETTRVTHGTDDHPLVLEVLRTNANRAQLAYRLAP